MIGRRIAKALEEHGPAAGESQTVSSFLRGLTAGALIGAAIAGSALLQRRRASRLREEEEMNRGSGQTESNAP
jgi:hypothetical protein